jgi:predicted ArsR family transcriptional regulator
MSEPGAESPLQSDAKPGDLLRLDLLKALGDNTRYAIYLEIARSAVPLSTSKIAETLGLHPNTIRPHLERMRDVGLLVQSVGPSRGVGRPQHLWSLAPEAPSLGLEPPVFTMLAKMMLEIAAAAGADSETAEQVGEREGRVQASRRERKAPCLIRLVRFLDDLGFEPLVFEDHPVSGTTTREEGDCRDGRSGAQSVSETKNRVRENSGKVTVAFMNCPFEDLARECPDLVCSLHCGLLQGFLGDSDDAHICEFRSLVAKNPCQVDLVLAQ